MPEPRFQRHNSGSSHYYTLDGERITGVTTAIGALDKPALVGWAAKESANYAVEHWDELAQKTLGDRIEAIKSARFQKNKAAVVRGNRVHALGERIAHGEEVDVPAELVGPVDAYARFLDAWDFETIATETPVCRTDYRYGGTLDAIVESDRFGTVLLDIKTGSGVYDEVGLQLAAYRYADVMLEEVEQTGPRGGRKPSVWVEKPMIEVDRVMVAHVKPDAVDLVPVAADQGVWRTFLYVLEVFESYTKRTQWKYKNEPTFAPLVGKPIYPEEVAS